MIYPIVLCGGSGTRLWPLSRKSYPKQFSDLIGGVTLFQASANRFRSDEFTPPIVVTSDDFRFIVAEQLRQIDVTAQQVLIEPQAKDTGPAVLAGTLAAYRYDPKALVLVAPSDHLISDAPAFQRTVLKGVEAAKSGQIVTFGIQPTHAETAYGYLELDGSANQADARRAVALKQFVEKPDVQRAAQMVAAGNFLWNAGIFLAQAKDLIAAFQTYAPGLFQPVNDAVDNASADLDFCRLERVAWSQCPAISIDYAVMEPARNLCVVPFAGQWSDLGGWDAVWHEMDKLPDQSGVATRGNVTSIECRNSLLRAENDEIELVSIGLDNCLVIAMNDAVLVADRNRAQDVKKAVTRLKEKNRRQATDFPKKHRPWGWFESLVINEHFQVNRVHLNPKASLSLRRHHYRSEHWIVVQGSAEIDIDGNIKRLEKYQSTYISKGIKHRLSNPSTQPLVLIETQTGAYLSADDIIRFDA